MRWVACLLLVSVSAFAPMSVSEETKPSGAAPGEPRDVGLVERASARLAQLDVTVTGPAEAISGLTREDFRLVVGYTKIENFTVDPLCEGEEALPEPSGPPSVIEKKEVPPALPPPPATFVFYFEQPFLTQAGRQRAIDMTREIVPKLMAGGNRAMLVSNAMELRTLVPLTDDPAKILGALDGMETNRFDWDPYMALEENRIAEVTEAITEFTGGGGGVQRAIAIALRHQNDETFRQAKSLHRLHMVLGTLAAIRPPKAVLYFADALRRNPGEHYMSFFGRSAVPEQEEALSGLRAEAGRLTLDRVINGASSMGIRFYTVEAQGLVAPPTMTSSRASARTPGNLTSPNMNMVRIRDAESTLQEIADETGGEAFLHGVAAPKVAQRILSDFRCVYLLSYEPVDLPLDSPLRVKVVVKRPGVKVHVRGRTVLPTEEERNYTRLLSAFALPEADRGSLPVRAALIPTGHSGKSFSAIVQVSVPASVIAGATWDLGASLVSGRKVREQISGRATVNVGGVPVVLVREMAFSEGPFELIAVARESASDEVGSSRLEGTFPEIDAALASIGPIAVVQPAQGAFLRDETVRTSASLAIPEGLPAKTMSRTALVALICRAKDQKGSLRVERRVIGATEAPFPPTEMDLGEDRCALLRDEIPAGTLTAGTFRYEVRVLSGESELVKAEREFDAE